jgi:hypothetical protein
LGGHGDKIISPRSKVQRPKLKRQKEECGMKKKFGLDQPSLKLRRGERSLAPPQQFSVVTLWGFKLYWSSEAASHKQLMPLLM